MAKHVHEFRDPIHVFVRVNSDERRVIDSEPFQRLRHIHQLALTYLVYPGATHKRFEHSLGVMELAGRVYDVITKEGNLCEAAREIIPDNDARVYWRRVLRLAALLHDIGHLPFSHAAEAELLPDNWSHESLTVEAIKSGFIADILGDLTPPVKPEHVYKIAVGPKELKDTEFTEWEAIMSEVITGNVFGVDRMDYLLRDAYHCGVAYGRFDHFRLVDCLRILPKSYEGSDELTLGVESGGLHSAEALLLARYFMFTQVYLHPIRRIYDLHLQDFFKCWLPDGHFPIEVADHLSYSDTESLAAIRKAAKNEDDPAHEPARRITCRDHFKICYERNPADVDVNPDAAQAVEKALQEKYSAEQVRYAPYDKSGQVSTFPIAASDGKVGSGLAASDVLRRFPPTNLEYVYVEGSIAKEAREWLDENKAEIIKRPEEEGQQ